MPSDRLGCGWLVLAKHTNCVMRRYGYWRYWLPQFFGVHSDSLETQSVSDPGVSANAVLVLQAKRESAGLHSDTESPFAVRDPGCARQRATFPARVQGDDHPSFVTLS